MRSLKRAGLLLGCWVFVGVFSGVSSCQTTKSDFVEFTLLHTNDIHSHFKAEAIGSEKNPYGLGGLARLKTLVDQRRTEKPGALLVDAGDWSEGSFYFNIDGGENMLRLMREIGYNAAVVGNHDFLNGPLALVNSIERAFQGGPSFAIVGANKNLSAFSSSDQSRIQTSIKDYVILNAGSVRIAFVGVLTDELLYYEYFRPGVISNPLTRISAITEKIHNEKIADVIVLLSHNSFSKHPAWAKSIPYVNIIISGHSHAKTATPIEVKIGDRTVYIVEAKEWAQFLGEFTLALDRSNGHVELRNYTLHPVSQNIAEDAKIAAMIAEQDLILREKYQTQIDGDIVHKHAANCSEEMPHTDTTESALTNLAADAYRTAAQTEIALESGQLAGIGLHTGALTSLDIANVAPHIFNPATNLTWTLKKLTLSGRDLRALLNIALLADTAGIPIGWISTSGANITYSAASSAGASPVRRIEIQGLPIQDDQNYSIALHDGLLLALRLIVGELKKLGLPTSINLSQIEETGIETWVAMLRYAKGNPSLETPSGLGSRVRVVEPDLAVYGPNIQFAKNKNGINVVRVLIKNTGLQAASARLLKMWRSPANDVVLDDTADQKFITIADNIEVPALDAGESTTLEIPWDLSSSSTPTKSVFTIGVQIYSSVAGAKEANEKNNRAVIHRSI